MEKKYTDINSAAIDKWVADDWIWGRSISHDEYVKAQNGQWGVVLTPQVVVPHEWFAPYINNSKLNGAKLLGLASGGGQQMPIFAAAGAECTILDYSKSQLDSEQKVAEREGYNINIVKADMTKRLPFEDESFDIIFHPVSNCYIEDVQHVLNECYRVLKKGGILLAGMDNSINYLVEESSDPLKIVNKLPYNPLKDEALYKKNIEEDGSIQFSHSLEEQIGGQLNAGFIITNLFEDRSPPPCILSQYTPLFFATRSIKATINI